MTNPNRNSRDKAVILTRAECVLAEDVRRTRVSLASRND
jgi:hypothetical protein